MIVKSAKVKLYAPVCHSLKDKRMIVKSIIDKVHRRFNVSISEVEAMDKHQSIVVGIACVSNAGSHANTSLQMVVNFIENNVEADIVDVEWEI